jgi:6-pyruvoyl tetrahydropterin synthase/QueD family protein
VRNLIAVRHNIEVAHRLYTSRGKCEAIHGHSMWVNVEIEGNLDEHGMLGGIDFGVLKKIFRGYLDTNFDHHIILNQDDPFAQPLWPGGATGGEITSGDVEHLTLPGLTTFVGDPTTENIAKNILTEMLRHYQWTCAVEVWETSTNMARVEK